MKIGQARDLLLYALVMKSDDPTSIGMVMDQGPAGVSIRWGKGQIQWLTHAQMNGLEPFYPTTSGSERKKT